MSERNNSVMKAALVSRYGAPSVVRVAEVARPRPGDGELLVRVHASTVASGDARIRGLRVPGGFELLMRLALGWSGPRQPVLGTELSGVVCEVGSGVKRHRVGDEVIASTGASLRAHAEYALVRDDGRVVAKPAGMSFEEAAGLCFGGLTAMHYLRREARVRAGERVLILGASGAVGAAAVQVARRLGAVVTGACSEGNAEMVRALGAASVIDYRREDFTARDEVWDVVMDCVGATNYARCRRSLAPGGRLLRVVAPLAGVLAAPLQGRLSGHRVIAGVTEERLEDMYALCAMVREGALRVPIDSSFSLERVAEAHARVDTGRKRGAVVLSVRG